MMCCDGDGKREWRMRVAESADALYVALTAGVGRDSAIALYRSVAGHGLPPTPEQPVFRWCVEHGRPESRFYPGRCGACLLASVCRECRVVDAFVVPLLDGDA